MKECRAKSNALAHIASLDDREIRGVERPHTSWLDECPLYNCRFFRLPIVGTIETRDFSGQDVRDEVRLKSPIKGDALRGMDAMHDAQFGI